jgi:serine-type D-Ala-D-Ala carboxypeptidase (penicillin-binding protein 5/6)
MAGNCSRYGLIVFLAWFWVPAAWAQDAIVPPPPAVAASSYLLIDANTREVLVEHNIHQPLPPASLTKIMTAYIAEIELEGGRVSLEDQVPVSVAAWRTGGSRMFIREGTQVSLDDLLRGVIIQSGNDASVAIAEHVAGSEAAFADMMNRQAKLLGMNNSNFKNATGLPDDEHYTTAWDLAILTQALIKNYPEHYAIYAERTFTFNGIDQPNRNRLLWRDRTVDGVKTGHTEAAGYCLVASALRDDMRLISVVMGTDSDESRMRESQKLLSYGFRHFETQRVYEGGLPLKTARLWYGDRSQIELGAADHVYVTIPRGRYEDVEAELHVARVIEAPVQQGQEFGELRLKLDGRTVQKIPLVALQAVEEGNFFSRLLDAIHLFFRNLLADD